jgi:hypothetical protein
MSTIEAPVRSREDERRVKTGGWIAQLRDEPSARTAGFTLAALFVLSFLFRAFVALQAHAPTAFSDELGYTKLALHIARTGHLGLFDKPGLSYSPLYPLVLAPIYRLGVSAPTAYSLVKVVSAFLISLSVFPTYAIARFVLSRRLSLLVAGLGAAAPLMMYPSFTMSENLAYPLFLVAIWALLRTMQRPGFGADALLLGSILVATAARVQLIVLVPIALTAILLGPALGLRDGERIRTALAQAVREHLLLFGIVVGGLVLAGLAGLAGVGVFNAGGRYAVVGRKSLPNLWHFLDILLRHIAGLDLAVGVVPFVAALVATFAFVRARRPRPQAAFAAVAVSATVWIVVETAFDAAAFDSPAGDVPRIHERFMIYVVPFFLVAVLAVYRMARVRASKRVFLVAAAIAALLPATIPFHTVVSNVIAVDSFGLHPFARIDQGALAPIPYAPLAAVWLGGTLALLYVQVRERLRAVILVVLIPFLIIWFLGSTRIEQTSAFARSTLPAHPNWVDRANPSAPVLLISVGPKDTAILETAYENNSIGRVAALCRTRFGPDFGEQTVTLDRSGRMRDASGFVEAPYVVVPWKLGVRGRVVAWNVDGGEVLVKTPPGPLVVSPLLTTAEYCGA